MPEVKKCSGYIPISQKSEKKEREKKRKRREKRREKGERKEEGIGEREMTKIHLYSELCYKTQTSMKICNTKKKIRNTKDKK